MKITKVFVIVIFISTLFSQNQIPFFESFTIENGLSNNVITSIIQDKFGYIWIGTQDGLNRYDGYSFKIYKNKPFDKKSLPGSWIECLLEDDKGNIWIGTNSQGVFYFDRVKNKFYNYFDKKNNSNNRVWTLYKDRNGIVWSGTTSGLNKYNKSLKTFEFYKKNVEGDYPVNAICEDNNGELLLGIWGCYVDRFNYNTKEFTDIPEYDKLLSRYKADKVKTIIKDSEGTIWIGTINGLFYLDSKGLFRVDKINRFNTDCDNYVLSLCESRDKKNIWIGTHIEGIIELNKKSKKLEHYKLNYSFVNSLNDNWISALMEDNSGILWIGSGKGINKFQHLHQEFFNILPDTKENKLNDVFSILEDDEDNLWIANWGGGILRFNQKTQKTINYKMPLLFVDNVVWVLAKLKDKTIIGGSYKGLFQYKDGKFSSFIWSAEPIQDNISTIYEDRNGNIWIGTWGNGLYKLYCKNSKKHSAHYLISNSGLSDNFITTIVEDNKGDLWIGTNTGGLNHLKTGSDNFIVFNYNENDKNSISNNSIKALYVDKGNVLWIGTWGGGLNRYDFKSKKFKHFSGKDGLLNDIILAIIPDGNNNLWLSTSRGLSQFKIKKEEFINFDKKDGIKSEQFSQGYLKTKKGMIIIGGTDGLTCFYPDRIKYTPFDRECLITSIKIMGEERYGSDTLNLLKKIKLHYTENRVEFNFSSMDFMRPEKNKYKYFLEGFDDKWQTSEDGKAIYSNISPGDYTFKVRSINRDNKESQYFTSIRLSISAPFWNTWWFYAHIFAGVFVIVGLLYHQKFIQLKKITKMRADIAKDLHDDVGSSLTRIALYSDASIKNINKGTHESKHKALNYLNEIGLASRELIASMSDIVWAVNQKNDDTENVVLRLKNYVSKILPLNAIDYKIFIDEEIEKISFSLEFRRNFFLIMKEIINNVIKHSKADFVDIKMTKKQDRLLLVIKDNGTGFVNNNESEGNGLKNIETRVKTMNGILKIESKQDEGTSVIMEVKADDKAIIFGKYLNIE